MNERTKYKIYDKVFQKMKKILKWVDKIRRWLWWQRYCNKPLSHSDWCQLKRDEHAHKIFVKALGKIFNSKSSCCNDRLWTCTETIVINSEEVKRYSYRCYKCDKICTRSIDKEGLQEFYKNNNIYEKPPTH